MKTFFHPSFFGLLLMGLAFSCSSGSNSTPSPSSSTDCNTNKPVLTASQLTGTPCGQSTGSLEAKASGGTGKLTYSINGTNFQDANTFQNLAAGKYTVTVKDEKGCTNTAQATIESNVSFQSTIKPLIEANCAVSGCHAGTQSPDFRVFSNIQANANNIKARTGAKTMPPTGSLTEQQINLIKCWVDDGAKNN